MRILANENVPRIVVESLRAAGQEVAWVGDESPGAFDEVVLARALSEARLLVTFDKDFGELVYRRGKEASCGVALFRLPVMPPEALASFVVQALGQRADWAGHFSVIEVDRIRMRTLP